MQNYEQPILSVLLFEEHDVLAADNSRQDDIGGIPDGWGGAN